MKKTGGIFLSLIHILAAVDLAGNLAQEPIDTDTALNVIGKAGGGEGVVEEDVRSADRVTVGTNLVDGTLNAAGTDWKEEVLQAKGPKGQDVYKRQAYADQAFAAEGSFVHLYGTKALKEDGQIVDLTTGEVTGGVEKAAVGTACLNSQAAYTTYTALSLIHI